MAETTLLQETIKILPVVVGAILAISGGIASQFLTHHMSKSRERKKLLRERIESLVKTLYDQETWLKKKHNDMLFQKLNHTQHQPLDEAVMLQKLYFPELAGVLSTVWEESHAMNIYIDEQTLDQLEDKAAWHEAWDKTTYVKLHKTLHDAIDAMVAECRKILLDQLGD